MKRLLSIGLLTVCALAVSERQADAWVNAKFSIGLNWHVQSANNNVLWGLWKNGQVPGPEAFGGAGGPFQYGPGPQMPPTGTFPWFGNAPSGVPNQTAPPPQTAQQQAYYYGAPQNYAYNPYQTASYQTGGYYPSYSYPGYYQNPGYQVPYYWYQGR